MMVCMRRLFEKSAGFTLIELMVTISVAAILLAVAVPNFRDLIMNNRLASQTNDFVSTLNMARSEAVKRSTAVSILAKTPSASNEFGGGWTIFVDTNRNGVIDSGELTLRDNGNIEGGNTLDSRNNISVITFLPSGFANMPVGASCLAQTASGSQPALPAQNALCFTLCDSRLQGRQVRIVPTGRISTTVFNC